MAGRLRQRETMIPQRRGLLVACAALATACEPESGVALPETLQLAGANAGPPPPASPTPSIRRVWANPVGGGGRPSPDGRYFAYADDDGNLALRDRVAGTHRAVTERTDTSGYNGWGAAISPDGRSIAYAWTMGRREELRVTTLSGPDSGATRLIAEFDARWVGVDTWTPDGNAVVGVVWNRDGSYRIFAASADRPAVRTLGKPDGRAPENLSMSTDGRWIAFDVPSPHHGRDVHVMDARGGRRRVAFRSARDDLVLGWLDPRRLLVLSDHAGTPAAWALSLSDGNMTGEPLLIRKDLWRASPAGLTRDGTTYFMVTTGEDELFTVQIGTAGVADAASEVAVTDGVSKAGWNAAWSPDGEHIAFVVPRADRFTYYGVKDVIVQAAARGTRRRLAPKLADIREIVWASPGSLLLVGTGEDGQFGIFRMDLSDASVERIMHIGYWGRAYPWNLTASPDGSRIVFSNLSEDDTEPSAQINELDLSTGAVSLLRRLPADGAFISSLSFSPDGTLLAASAVHDAPGSDRILIIPVAGGPIREAFRAGPDERIGGTAGPGVLWMRDGRHLLFGLRAAVGYESTPVYDIRRLALADGRLTSIGLHPLWMGRMALRPDGGELMYSAGEQSGEIWAMEPPVFQAGTSRPVGSR